MSAQYWFLKFAPFRTSWSEVIARGIFTPRGIRSPLARKHLSQMKTGDRVFFYQSQKNQAILGLMSVTKESYPDPTSADPKWLTCDFQPISSFSAPIPLATLRAEQRVSDLELFRQPRLAVFPVNSDIATWITKASGMTEK